MSAFDWWQGINATVIVLGILIVANLLGGRSENGRLKHGTTFEKRKQG